jgi:hypothetical protein
MGRRRIFWAATPIVNADGWREAPMTIEILLLLGIIAWIGYEPQSRRVWEQVKANERLLLEMRKELKSLRADVIALKPEVTVRRVGIPDTVG